MARRASGGGMHRALTAALLAACAPRLGHPEVSYGEPRALPIVQPSTDARRWYVAMDTEELGPVLWFVDTGYTYSTCDDGLVDGLELATAGRVRVRGEVGSVHATKARLPAFELGGHRVEGLACQVRDLHTTSSLLDPPEVPIAGVIGMDVLRRFRVVFAPEAGRIELLDPANADALPRRAPHVSRLRRPGLGNRARMALAIGEAGVAWPIVDTGAASTYVDGERLGLEPRSVADSVVVRATGTGQQLRATYAVDDLHVGGRPAGATTLVDRDRRTWEAGLLGLDLLSRFHQEYDFARRRALLQPVEPAPVPKFTAWWTDEGDTVGARLVPTDAVTDAP